MTTQSHARSWWERSMMTLSSIGNFHVQTIKRFLNSRKTFLMNRSIVLDSTKSAARSSKCSLACDIKNKWAGYQLEVSDHIINIYKRCSLCNETTHSANAINFGIFRLIKGKNKWVNRELITTVLAVIIRWQHAHHKNGVGIVKGNNTLLHIDSIESTFTSH